MGALRDAASFLTRVPLAKAPFAESGSTVVNMSRAVPWFPVIGVLLGALQGGIYLGVLELSTPLLAATISTGTLALITGAFHHDGLADMADAFGGGWTVEQRLEILKDSRLGTYGVTALIFVIVTEVAALSALAGWRAFFATVAAHGVSRAVAGCMMLIAPPAQSTGLGVDYLRGLSRPAVLVGAGLVGVGVAVVFRLDAIAVVGGAALVGVLVVRVALAKIGGISGDVLGAVQQLAKIAVLIAVVLTTA